MEFDEQYALWDEFLKAWPLDRLNQMTLAEYSSQGNRDTFTYWIEHRLSDLGSIRGGSSFKFGVYSRAQGGADIQDDATRSYTPSYAWYTRLGETAVAAFERVKESIIKVADFAKTGELDSIDNVEYLGESYKWKIAFLYQDRDNPIIVGVFKREMLSAFLGNPDINTMAALQNASIAKKPKAQNILEFGPTIWNFKEVDEEITLTNHDHDPGLNLILYGPPGTGKTHALTALTLSVLNPKQTVCHSYVQSLVYGSALEPIDSGDYENWHTALQKHLHEGRVEFTTFHQNYAYEDFVEGLKAKLEGTTVHYTIEPGIFKRMAYRALYAWLTGKESGFELSQDELAAVNGFLSGEPAPDPAPESIPSYVLIIDEINRGNVARIFGELITLVEDSKRACRNIIPGAQPVFATLPYTKDRFILPPNLYIIGTMNTADRSLIGLDAALRRRFDFIELPPRPELLSNNIDGVQLSEFLSQLNARIERNDTRDHCIGHAIFMPAKSIEDIAYVMRRKVIPQLQEYFHDRPQQLSEILTFNGNCLIDKSGRINHDLLKHSESYNNFGWA